jgi:hypothetical protein
LTRPPTADGSEGGSKSSSKPSEPKPKKNDAPKSKGGEDLVERRLDDGNYYSQAEFKDHYGDVWKKHWDRAKLERRADGDGKLYSMKEFKKYYERDWKTHWENAPRR